MVSTSRPKIAPASGVPNTDEKPAAMPPISRMRRASRFRPNTAVMRSASAPPICTAVPSRPAEPPSRWVITVATSTSGAMRFGTIFRGSWISSISRLLPPSTDWPTRAYTQAGAKPANGSSHSIQAWATRKSVARSSAYRNRAEAVPASAPRIDDRTSQRATWGTIATCSRDFSFFMLTRFDAQSNPGGRRSLAAYTAHDLPHPGTRRHHQPRCARGGYGRHAISEKLADHTDNFATRQSPCRASALRRRHARRRGRAALRPPIRPPVAPSRTAPRRARPHARRSRRSRVPRTRRPA